MWKKTKKSLFIINGWGDFKSLWEPFIKKLQDLFNVTLIPISSFCDSSDFLGSTHRLKEIIPDHSYLIGWSLGAQFAMQLAQDKDIKKLMTIAYNPKFVADENSPGMDMASFQAFNKKVSDNPKEGLHYFMKLVLFGENDFKQRLKQLSKEPYLYKTKEELIETLEMLKNNDQRNLTKKHHASTAHIYGGKDYLVPVNVSYCFDSLAVKIIDGAGHAPFFSHPEACVQRVNEFIHE